MILTLSLLSKIIACHFVGIQLYFRVEFHNYSLKIKFNENIMFFYDSIRVYIIHLDQW